MKKIEVCLSPALFEFRSISENCIVVVIDVLRATTSFCAAFDSGVRTIIPVAGLDELLIYKNKGYLTAAERNGGKVEFADFGNSPTAFLKSQLHGKDLAYSTTNGTQAIELAKSSGNITVACFANLAAVSRWLHMQNIDLVILCSGWKNMFSLEDTLCAGALIATLSESRGYELTGDASDTALILWNSSKNDLNKAVENAEHYKRLSVLGHQDDLRHCFIPNSSEVVPVWDGTGFINVSSSVE